MSENPLVKVATRLWSVDDFFQMVLIQKQSIFFRQCVYFSVIRYLQQIFLTALIMFRNAIRKVAQEGYVFQHINFIQNDPP